MSAVTWKGFLDGVGTSQESKEDSMKAHVTKIRHPTLSKPSSHLLQAPLIFFAAPFVQFKANFHSQSGGGQPHDGHAPHGCAPFRHDLNQQNLLFV